MKEHDCVKVGSRGECDPMLNCGRLLFPPSGRRCGCALSKLIGAMRMKNDRNYNTILREALDRYDHRETNGDKLRSMTNEQLARYLWIETDRMTPEEWLDWLNAT